MGAARRRRARVTAARAKTARRAATIAREACYAVALDAPGLTAAAAREMADIVRELAATLLRCAT